ncbi:hypothetical protein [Pelagicoccus sp. SDUM812003]|uniref:hypothetical protein n=1 Tax=Pelagicoccus sp. SDUM812003 TaxID=3041267 RepID=UPI00280D3BEB|nr:hypothetical protein [Pelagicoccus sp. SDUM812003]MDQ8203970.1 hypothetical protein [Pelagicoccus sp. SDUM812003]
MKIRLNESKVPEGLRSLIPFAEEFGVSDDGYRFEKIEKTPKDRLALLRELCIQKDDELDEWLAGPEANGPTFSEEYIAFSSMRMAADEF